MFETDALFDGHVRIRTVNILVLLETQGNYLDKKHKDEMSITIDRSRETEKVEAVGAPTRISSWGIVVDVDLRSVMFLCMMYQYA